MLGGGTKRKPSIRKGPTIPGVKLSVGTKTKEYRINSQGTQKRKTDASPQAHHKNVRKGGSGQKSGGELDLTQGGGDSQGGP